MSIADPDLVALEFCVRQLQAKCVDAVWRKDADAFASLFTPDGVWKVAGLSMAGRTAIASGFRELTAVNERVLMRFATPIIAWDGESASARTYTIENVKRLDGQAMSSIGIYYERFALEGADWNFAWRHFDFCYFGPPDLSADLFPFVDRGPSPALPSVDEPTAGM